MQFSIKHEKNNPKSLKREGEKVKIQRTNCAIKQKGIIEIEIKKFNFTRQYLLPYPHSNEVKFCSDKNHELHRLNPRIGPQDELLNKPQFNNFMSKNMNHCSSPKETHFLPTGSNIT